VVAAGVVVTMLAGGCSFFVMRAPAPPKKPRVNVACTEERYAPAIDLGSFAGSIGYAFASGGDAQILVPALIGSAVYLASAVYGFRVSNECVLAKDEAYKFHARELRGQTALLRRIAEASESESAEDEDDGDGEKAAPARPAAPPVKPPASPPPATPEQAQPPAPAREAPPAAP
jgi:hypothetical protein